MTLEDILTNRTRISEHILRDVKESATSYGVAIARADVKDLVFPGKLQESPEPRAGRRAHESAQITLGAQA